MELKLEDATIIVDDSCVAKNEIERQQRIEIFNNIGCEILNSQGE